MAKYKSVLVTVNDLKKWDACDEGIKWFKDNFPKGVRISNSQDEMNDLLATIHIDVIYHLKWFLWKVGVITHYGYPLQDSEFCLTHEAGAFLSDCELLK